MVQNNELDYTEASSSSVIDNYLTNNASVELKDLITDAMAAFDSIGFDGYDDVFLELIMVAEQNDKNFVVDQITMLTKEYLINILKEHGIFVSDASTIDILTIFVNGIVSLLKLNDKQDVLNILKTSINSVEKFAEVISLISNKSADELMLDIETVSDSFISSLINHFEKEEYQINEDEVVQTQTIIKRFKEYTEFVGSTLKIEEYLKSGLSVGFPYQTYLNLYGHEIEELSVDDIAKEMLGMAIISNDGMNNPISVIASSIDSVISDLDKITKVNVRVTQLLLEFQK